MKLKIRTEFSNVWGECKHHSSPYIHSTTVLCDICIPFAIKTLGTKAFLACKGCFIQICGVTKATQVWPSTFSVSILLLANGTGVCATQESDVVVLTTASQLRKEIKSQLNEALAEALPELCSSRSYGVQYSSGDDIVAAVMQELKEVVKDCINDIYHH